MAISYCNSCDNYDVFDESKEKPANFCTECGSKMIHSCPNCDHYRKTSSAKFCPNCGKPYK